MLKLLNLGMTGVTQGDTAPVFGSKINHMVEELYGREGVDIQTNELPSARPIATGGTGATSQKSAAKNILPAASARQTIRYNGTDWVSEDEVTQIALATDWDTLVNAGVYYAPFVIGDGVSSPPDIWAYGFLRVTRSGDWIMQEVIGDDSRKSTRFSVNGGVTWKVWSDESTTADTARKLLNPVKINGTDFDGSADINIPAATSTAAGVVKLVNDLITGGLDAAITAEQIKLLYAIFSGVKGTTGHIKIPCTDGKPVIIQWVESQIYAANTGAVGWAASLPVTFPNACLYYHGNNINGINTWFTAESGGLSSIGGFVQMLSTGTTTYKVLAIGH